MLRPVALPNNLTDGNLYLSSMPGYYSPMKDFLQSLTEASVDHIVCLVPDEEIAWKSPDYHTAIQRGKLPAKLWRLGIQEHGDVENIDEFNWTLDLLVDRMAQGESVVIHCHLGQYRTGMVSTHMLVRLGLPREQAIQLIQDAGSRPDYAV